MVTFNEEDNIITCKHKWEHATACKHIILNVYVLVVCILLNLRTSRRGNFFLENVKLLIYIIFS